MSQSQLKILEMAMMQSWNAIVITDANLESGCRVLIANPSFCKMTGYSLEELKGQTLKKLQGPDTDPAVISRLRVCLNEARYFEGTTVNYRKDGSSYIVHWNISPVRGDDGKVTHFVSVQQDMSEYVRAEQKIELLARALDVTSTPVLLTDARAQVIFVNRAFSDITGYAADELVGKTPALLQSGKHDKAFYDGLRESLASGQDFNATFVNRRRDGSLYHAAQSISPIADDTGKITHYVSVSKDISERVQQEEALRHEASQDKLTGFYNRRYGEQLLNQAHQNAVSKERPLTVVFCDIDHFKRVNDQFGHPAGDRVLKEVSAVMGATVRSRDVVIRWGGEEFVIVLADCGQAPAAELAERLRSAVSAHENTEVGPVTMSFGLATLLPDESVEQLVKRADLALYESKANGRNQVTAWAAA